MSRRHYGVPHRNPLTTATGAVPGSTWSASVMVGGAVVVLILAAAVIYDVTSTVATLISNTPTSAPPAAEQVNAAPTEPPQGTIHP